MELLGIAHTAMGHHGGLAGGKTGFRRQIFRGIGFRPARLARVVQGGGFPDHGVGGFQMGPGRRKRMLDRLILADGPVKDHTLLGVIHCLAQGRPAQADRFRRHQNAFGIDAVD